MSVKKTFERGIRFLTKQEKAFQVNLVRASTLNFFRNLIVQYQSSYITKLGASALELGIVNSIGGLASTSIALPTGWIADRFGIAS